MFKVKAITRNRKKNIYSTIVKSILTYKLEAWRLTEEKSKLLAVEMDTLRRFYIISEKKEKKKKKMM